MEKILRCQEYCGDIINFKTYSKSFKNKARLENPEENLVIFKNIHEPIIDRETFEQVQKLLGSTKRRAPKQENSEKNLFCDLLHCADCGKKLWYHNQHCQQEHPLLQLLQPCKRLSWKLQEPPLYPSRCVGSGDHGRASAFGRLFSVRSGAFCGIAGIKNRL